MYYPKEHEYTTYPRRFDAYRWYKPILVLILFLIFYLIFGAVVIGIGGLLAGNPSAFFEQLQGGYDTLDVYTPSGVLVNLGGVAVMLPALALAALIVRNRPFSSYSSARGGWDWGLFVRFFGIACIVCALPIIIISLLYPAHGINQFTVAGFVLLTILGPLQCVAEEYFFRGLLMQTFGSWFRLPVVAIILQSLVFAALHPYNALGVVTIVISGLAFGIAAWVSKGLEVSAALHIVNNMTAFYLTGFGLSSISADLDIPGFILDVAINVVYVLVVVIISRKYDWFDRVKADDVAAFDRKRVAKKARKAAKKAARSL